MAHNDVSLVNVDNNETGVSGVYPKIASVSTIRVHSILVDTSDISNVVFNPDSNDDFYKVYPTIEKKLEECMSKEKEIRLGDFADEEKMETLIALKFDAEGMREKGLSIFGSERLNHFDRNVLDAITSLQLEGLNKYISVNMIYQVLAGKRKKASTNYADEINNSITKLIHTHIVAKSYYIDHADELMDFRVLPVSRVRAKLNGYEVPCIRIDGNLPLFMHAGFRDKLFLVDFDLINMPFANDKRVSKAHMDVLHYLLRQIITSKSKSNRIKYKTIYHELGYDNASRKITYDTRKRIKAILDAWKGLEFGNVQFIDYDENKRGVFPYEITLNFKRIKNKEATYRYYSENEYF